MSFSKLTYLLLLCISTTSFAQSFSYPIQEFRFGIANTNRSITISNTVDKSYLSSSTFTGLRNEKWYLNYISTGVYEIVNSLTGLVVTNDNGTAVISTDTDAANQRWKIVAVEKDFEKYDLYYKIVSNVNSDLAFTFNASSNSIALENYSGSTYQKYKLNLDGMEGYAANSVVSGKEKAGTIGGLLGATVFVSTIDALVTALNKTEPLTVVLTENLDMINHNKTNQRIRDNKTLVGSYAKNIIYDCQLRNDDFYGKDASPSNNIVIRNIDFISKTLNANGSGVILIQIFGGRNIWIDHNNFSTTFSQNKDAEVGKFIWINTPAKNWSDSAYNLINPDYITISYNYFKNRFWTVAFGSQNTDRSRLRTSLMFNKWKQCSRRTPQYSNGYHHNYSSFHTVTGSSNPNASSQVIAGEGSRVLNENCRFEAYTGNETSIDRSSAVSFHDNNSYTASTTSSTPTKLSSTSLGSPWKASDSYGYHLVSGYNSNGKDTKAFCNAYSGAFKSYAQIKYITDSDLSSYISYKYESPFLVNIEVGNDPVGTLKTGATMDTSYKYVIQNLNSKLFFTLANAIWSNGVTVQQSKNGEAWKFSMAEDGYYYIYPANSNSYQLNLEEGNTTNGTAINIWTKSDQESQLFKFVANENNSYSISTSVTKDQSCLGVAAASKEESASIVQWSCNDSKDQQWIFNKKIDPINGTLIQNLLVQDTVNSMKWNIGTNTQIGSTLFGDRDFTYTKLPDFILGTESILTASDSKIYLNNLASFIASSDITVYVALDNRVSTIPSWLTSWTKTDSTIQSSNDVLFDVYEKNYKKGDSVILGTNGQASGCVNYVVFAAPIEITKINYGNQSLSLMGLSAIFDGYNLTIQNDFNQPASISLYNISGKKLFDHKVQTQGTHTFTLENKVSKGLYFIKAKNTNHHSIQKIFIK